jgi:hypothetical protein
MRKRTRSVSTRPPGHELERRRGGGRCRGCERGHRRRSVPIGLVQRAHERGGARQGGLDRTPRVRCPLRTSGRRHACALGKPRECGRGPGRRRSPAPRRVPTLAQRRQNSPRCRLVHSFGDRRLRPLTFLGRPCRDAWHGDSICHDPALRARRLSKLAGRPVVPGFTSRVGSGRNRGRGRIPPALAPLLGLGSKGRADPLARWCVATSRRPRATRRRGHELGVGTRRTEPAKSAYGVRARSPISRAAPTAALRCCVPPESPFARAPLRRRRRPRLLATPAITPACRRPAIGSSSPRAPAARVDAPA